MNETNQLNEYSAAFQVLNQIESNSNLFIGNSIIIRAFNLLLSNSLKKDVNIFLIAEPVASMAILLLVLEFHYPQSQITII